MPIRPFHLLSPAFVIVAMAVAHPQAASARNAPVAVRQAGRSLLDVQLFQLDQAHSSIEFAVRWMGLTKVKGTFSDFSGSIGYDPADLTRSSISVVVRTPSITTWNDHRDRDLRGSGFFDVQKYPTATFHSRSIERTADGFVLHGPFTLHDVTHDVAIPFTFIGAVTDSGGLGHRLGFEGHFTIDRKAYGIDGPADLNKAVPGMTELMISDQVEIVLSVQGWMWTPAKLGDPTADSLYQAIRARGVDVVAKDFRQLRARVPDSLMAVNEGVLNTVGYHLLRQGRDDDALGLFHLEAETYPGSAFGYVGLGQAYAETGNREAAVQNCETALQKNPAATRAIEILRRLRPTS